MNITFIGGGSIRLLPILRGVMQACPQSFQNSELRFYDLARERAEAVAQLVRFAPEFKTLKNCTVKTPGSPEEAFSGADVVYVTMGIRRQPSCSRAAFNSNELGFVSTDQLSITGAFLAVQQGPVILEIAKQMEQYCPNALMLIFANPVAVYCNMVNRFTRIRSLGICGGFNNHRWDLTQLCGNKGFDPAWDVVAAGVNHLSFILRGSYKGEDLYGSLFPRVLNENWKLPEHVQSGPVQTALAQFYSLYRRFGYIVFSSELDGLCHLFPEVCVAKQIHWLPDPATFDDAAAAAKEKEMLQSRFALLQEMAKQAETLDYDKQREDLFGVNSTDIAIPIFKALAGVEKMRIVAADVNRGVLKELPGDAAAEFTMDLWENQITPVENQFIPSPFRGVISALSEFQTLQADAIAKQDGKSFALALEAYPIQQFTEAKREVVRRHFQIYRDFLNAGMLEAEKYFLNEVF